MTTAVAFHPSQSDRIGRYILGGTLLLLALALLFGINPAHASETATGMEWESPLNAVVRSVTGPVAFGISFLGLVICGAVLIWGGEINEFVRRVVMVILVVSVIMFAGNLLRRMFAGGAATITPPAAEMVCTPAAVALPGGLAK